MICLIYYNSLLPHSSKRRFTCVHSPSYKYLTNIRNSRDSLKYNLIQLPELNLFHEIEKWSLICCLFIWIDFSKQRRTRWKRTQIRLTFRKHYCSLWLLISRSQRNIEQNIISFDLSLFWKLLRINLLNILWKWLP